VLATAALWTMMKKKGREARGKMCAAVSRGDAVQRHVGSTPTWFRRCPPLLPYRACREQPQLSPEGRVELGLRRLELQDALEAAHPSLPRRQDRQDFVGPPIVLGTCCARPLSLARNSLHSDGSLPPPSDFSSSLITSTIQSAALAPGHDSERLVAGPALAGGGGFLGGRA
jgi:hypothetical protein